MDFSNIKLIVSDMDGTLLNNKGEVSEHFFELFKKLKEKNITFCAASGRQFYSIKQKLSSIKNEIYVIAENGGITMQADKILNTYTLPLATIKKIVTEVRKIKKAEIVICGKKRAYIESNNENFIEFFKEFYVEYEKVEDLLEVSQDDFFKIAIYHPKEAEDYIYPFTKVFKDELQVKVSGEHWVDISSMETHKGNALLKLQNLLKIDATNTAVFGDYNNDLEMLKLADFSFAMANAHPNVKNTAKYSTKSNDENGVEYIIEQILNS
ncbi:hypothetical protein SAMN04488096_101152 [Mesonia phycicola]|uniref:Uncharacterized protein n=1 Tax=Mesonia phycicola TaxID=579105 RepID=A0A1M6A9D2_9FLAO|nr:HAD family hydrolase [Mesonia phycicola]SHI33062.1 hypothetical protein SAMN04488096_101152 [Mesonia phycicola]